MPIKFNTSIPQNRILNAYNNNVIEFYNDNSNLPLGQFPIYPVKATITISGQTFEITPNPQGVFYFNFKGIIPSLINANLFADTIQPATQQNDPDGMMVQDATLYLEVSASIVMIDAEDDSTAPTILNLKFIKGVEQEEDYKRNQLIQRDGKLALLLPFTPRSNKDYHATYFEGYPFDISIYSPTGNPVTIKHEGNQVSEEFTLPGRGVTRFYISDGDDNSSIDGVIPLNIGMNKLTFSDGGTERFTLHLTKVDSQCGTYFKWFNSQGGWSYFLFQQFDATQRTREGDTFTRDYKNLSNTDDRYIQTGVEVENTTKLFSDGLTQNQMDSVKGIAASPKVYRYLNEMFQSASVRDWNTTIIRKGSFRYFERLRNSYDVVIQTEQPQLNIQSL